MKLWWKIKLNKGLWSNILLSLSPNSRKKTSWSRILKVDLEASRLSKVFVRRGDCSFWFDNWSCLGVLWDLPSDVHPPQSHISIRDFFEDMER